MKPIYIILYAMIVILVLTLVLPRMRQASPALRRSLWVQHRRGSLAHRCVPCTHEISQQIGGYK
jgi:hypothetical protein